MDDLELRDRARRVEKSIAVLPDLLGEPSAVEVGLTAMHGSTYPTGSMVWVYVQIAVISGAEVEGGAVGLAGSGQYLWACSVGPVPEMTSPVLAKQHGPYWFI